MKKSGFDEKLIIEKEKLNRLADEALKKVSPLFRMRHLWSRTVRLTNLVVKAQRYQEQQRKKQQER